VEFSAYEGEMMKEVTLTSITLWRISQFCALHTIIWRHKLGHRGIFNIKRWHYSSWL